MCGQVEQRPAMAKQPSHPLSQSESFVDSNAIKLAGTMLAWKVFKAAEMPVQGLPRRKNFVWLSVLHAQD